MSRYLIDRIAADPRIDLLTATRSGPWPATPTWPQVTLEHGPTGQRRTVACAGLFCFIGAVPATGWLGDTVALDRSGFILTDRALDPELAEASVFAGREPLPFETSVPGVFAAGDVRQGSLKRVAAAVGEGSSAVRSVHDVLAATA